MSKRYFYTDPLAAAWMAKHHEIRFANGDSLRSACEMVGVNGRDLQAGGFYIHPDSLHLLEPQIGDTCRVPESCYVFMWENAPIGGDLKCRMVAYHDDDELKVRCFVTDEPFPTVATQIIQRKGMLFHWPESEDVWPK